MFWGLRSLWIMPLACRTLMAPAICCRKTRIVSSLSVPLAAEKQEVNTQKVNLLQINFGILGVLSDSHMLQCM